MNGEGKTIGETLREAREAKSLTVEQVNRETRISVQTLRSLERDDFGAFPSETYLKGFLRNYAEFLGLDGNALWAMVGSRASGRGDAKLAWEIEGTLKEEKLGPPRVIRRLILPMLVVMLVLFAWLWLREKRRADRVEIERAGRPVAAAAEVGTAG